MIFLRYKSYIPARSYYPIYPYLLYPIVSYLFYLSISTIINIDIRVSEDPNDSSIIPQTAAHRAIIQSKHN